jgi:hypothetical protein
MARKIEEPEYDTVIDDGKFTVRDYPGCVVAQTEVVGDWDKASNQGFRRLAAYIFGGNGGSERIAMTAPVGQRNSGEKIAMTTPVGMKQAGESWVISFTMPAAHSLQTLPVPNDSHVKLREVPGRRVAVIRFAGFWTNGRMERRTEALRSWIADHRLRATGEPEVNRYDPPWTLPFLRRNEVWIELEPAPDLVTSESDPPG